MNSCLYECQVMHHRLSPLKHRFVYKTFMFYLDLDEIDLFSKSLWLFSRNKFNVYNFRDSDHLLQHNYSVKSKITDYLEQNEVKIDNGKIMLLTNVATLGYNFNPVSFYFCFDSENNPVCVVPEVGNTFGELKPFFIGRKNQTESGFNSMMIKHFYVSPFINLDTCFDFRLKIPEEKLNILIDDFKGSEKIFKSALTGRKKTLNDFNLILFAVKYPFITLKVIGAIHFQALILYLKKLPYIKKDEHLELQKGVINK